MKLIYILILLATDFICIAQSERTQQLYTAKQRYEEPLKENFGIIVERLNATQREYLRNTDLQITLVDDILMAKTYSNPENKIEISAATILFLEELATTHAWYDFKGITDTTPIVNYVLLSRRYRGTGKSLKSMIGLLGLPEKEVWENPDNYKLKNMARNFLNSSVTWIIAHEIGHKASGHVDNPTIIRQMSSQEMEMQADKIATEMLISLGLFPEAVGIAMVYYSIYSKVRIEFPDNNAWNEYLSNSTHPIWPERLENLAKVFRSNASNISRSVEASTLQLDIAAGMLQNFDILSALIAGEAKVTENNLKTYDPMANIDPKYLPYSSK